MRKPTIFVSYSHQDELEKNKLVTHLLVLQQSGVGIDLWVDDRISAGADWAQAIDQAMDRASVALLLVTANFLTSEFITKTEVPRLLTRRKQEDLIVFPIIARPCAWGLASWLSPLNVRPKNGDPIWREAGRYVDEELTKIVQEVAGLLKQTEVDLREKSGVQVDPNVDGILIYIDCFGKPSRDLPVEAHHLDWTAHFDSAARPRRVPDPETWQKTLLPQLSAVEAPLRTPNLIRVRGSASLPAGFAVGHTFLEVARYQIEVEQFSDGIMQPWYSSARHTPTEFNERIIPGNPEADDAVVIVFANPKQNLNQIAGAVGKYFDETEAFILDSAEARSESFKKVLILEAEAASQEKRDLANWEAATLAKVSGGQMNRFIGQVQPKTIHLFLAVPVGLAVFLGHQWNIIDTKIQCYEWVGGEQIYAPACQLEL